MRKLIEAEVHSTGLLAQATQAALVGAFNSKRWDRACQLACELQGYSQALSALELLLGKLPPEESPQVSLSTQPSSAT